MQRWICYFSGRVQGVGFRYTAQDIAMQFNVKGYVKNLPDERVELVMEGSPADMQSVLDLIKDRMKGFVTKTVVSDAPATGEFKQFSIRHW